MALTGPGDFTAVNPRLWFFTLLLCVVVALAAAMGAIRVPLLDLFTNDSTALQRMVFWDIRAPRILLAGAVGAVLGLAGASLQGLFRNPLADPGLIGVSGGAALGAIAMIVLGGSLGLPAAMQPFMIPLSAIAGALLVTTFLYSFATWFGQFSIVTLLLVGIAINALSTVGIGIFQYVGDDQQLRDLVFWTMGSFGRSSWITTVPAVILMLLCGFSLLGVSRALDLMQLGEVEASYLGVDVEQVKRRTILVSAAAVGAGVALSGIIAFVGLVVPHVVRLLLGPLHRALLPGAALFGAALMVGADLIARTVIVPAELPVSLVTSAIGAPFFLWLITRMKRP